MNQSPSDRKDRTGGGDVTKAERLATPTVNKTVHDVLNQHSENGVFDSSVYGDEAYGNG
jgi:hypothetical protein